MSLLFQSVLINLCRARVKAYQKDALGHRVRLQKGSDFAHRDCGCTLERKVIDTGADGWEGYCAAVVFRREGKAAAIAVREQVILPALSAVPAVGIRR